MRPCLCKRLPRRRGSTWPASTRPATSPASSPVTGEGSSPPSSSLRPGPFRKRRPSSSLGDPRDRLPESDEAASTRDERRASWRNPGGASREISAREPRLLYLGIEGPIEGLSRAIGARLGLLDLEAAEGPIASGWGFFLLKPRNPHRAMEAAAVSPPALSFRECRISLYRLDFRGDPFNAIAWKETSSSWRPRHPYAVDGALPV
jgi:hypothetical protein